MEVGTPERVRELLRSGPVWGAEIDIRFRVLAVTIEPSTDVHPEPDTDDRRLLLVLHPVGAIAARLVQDADDGATILQFGEDQLPDVVSALDGPVPVGDPVVDSLPNFDAMADQLSMRGQAQTGDGTTHHLHLDLRADDLDLDLWASYDTAEIRSPGEVDAPEE